MKKKVLGIGNSVVDILIRIKGDALLDELALTKGSMTLVDRRKILAILEKVSDYHTVRSAGGSAANTINGLAKLGVSTGFIGKTGDDELGYFFNQDMVDQHIDTHISLGQAETGRVMVFITPDSERTFATYLGASLELSADDLDPAVFSGYDYFHFEGYLAHNRPLVERAAELARKAGCQISFDLASFGVVEANLEFLKHLIKGYVDIVFANEEEARAFTGEEVPRRALLELAKVCDVAVVKVGKEGSLIKNGSCEYKIEAVPAKAVDTTGAGDLWAAGFYFGLVNEQPLEICGHMASIVASRIVQVIGAKMGEEDWSDIKKTCTDVMSGAIV